MALLAARLALTNHVTRARFQVDPQHLEHTPPRITSNVKPSLKLLRLLREWQQSSTREEKPSTSYRKPKVDKKSIPDDFESYQDSSTQVLETGKEITIVQPVLLVDGYNMCGSWPKLKKHFSKGDLVMAREKLIDELVSFSAAKGIKVVVVFDAKQSGLLCHKETQDSIDIVYAADVCADTWIEREVYLLKQDGCPKIRVVTSDSIHRQVASGAGAYVWSCNMFIKEIKEVKKEVQQILQAHKPYSMEGKLLEHNLTPEVFNSLQALKQKLKMEEQVAVERFHMKNALDGICPNVELPSPSNRRAWQSFFRIHRVFVKEPLHCWLHEEFARSLLICMLLSHSIRITLQFVAQATKCCESCWMLGGSSSRN